MRRAPPTGGCTSAYGTIRPTSSGQKSGRIARQRGCIVHSERGRVRVPRVLRADLARVVWAQHTTAWSLLMAASMLATLPLVVFPHTALLPGEHNADKHPRLIRLSTR